MNPRLVAALGMAVAIAVPAEGIRQRAYRDPGGILTVCMGKTGNVDPTRTYSLAECYQHLDAEMMDALIAVENCVPGLPEHVLAAFADAVYNMGPRITCDTATSTAAVRLKNGDIRGACNELVKWDKAKVAGRFMTLPGLTKRRALEREVCLTGRMPA